MITLEIKNRAPELIEGNVIHLKIASIEQRAPGKWRLVADDITPLPGAEPTGYGCDICGIIEEAKPDGSLPDGWTEKRFEQGSHFVCGNEYCQAERICRVCGCTQEHACETDEGPCYWVEDDLCSACALSQSGDQEEGDFYDDSKSGT